MKNETQYAPANESGGESIGKTPDGREDRGDLPCRQLEHLKPYPPTHGTGIVNGIAPLIDKIQKAINEYVADKAVFVLSNNVGASSNVSVVITKSARITTNINIKHAYKFAPEQWPFERKGDTRRSI